MAALAPFKRKEFMQIQKCREATKEGHRGENKSTVPVQTFFTPILKAKSVSAKIKSWVKYKT
jgi:hypothetical protein